MIVTRSEVRPFQQDELDLMKGFADQAAIAIENARLVSELRESYRVVQQQAGKLEAQSQELVKLNAQLEQRVSDQVDEIERMSRLRRFLPPQLADLIVASGSEKQLESHRREITALFCDLRGFTGFTESADAEDVMALLRDYHAAIGEIIIKYNGTLERYAGDGVMVVFNDPVPVENPALQARRLCSWVRKKYRMLAYRRSMSLTGRVGVSTSLPVVVVMAVVVGVIWVEDVTWADATLVAVVVVVVAAAAAVVFALALAAVA